MTDKPAVGDEVEVTLRGVLTNYDPELGHWTLRGCSVEGHVPWEYTLHWGTTFTPVVDAATTRARSAHTLTTAKAAPCILASSGAASTTIRSGRRSATTAVVLPLLRLNFCRRVWGTPNTMSDEPMSDYACRAFLATLGVKSPRFGLPQGCCRACHNEDRKFGRELNGRGYVVCCHIASRVIVDRGGHPT
jgi:hypothetical protein